MEQRAQTRADLLIAARYRFLEVGYAAASLEDIADRAGYSKGAVYSNFVDKPNLCREVLQAIHEEKAAELTAVAAGEGVLAERIDRFADWAERTLGDEGWTMLELEFATVARNDPDLLAQIAGLWNDVRRTIGEVLADLVRGEAGPDAVVSDEARTMLASSADLLLSAGVGLGIGRAIDPTIATGPVIDSMRATLMMLVAAGS